MIELKQEHRMIEQAIRDYAEKEILPKIPEFESGRELPYDLMRRMMTDVMGASWIRDSLNRRADKMESGQWDASRSKGAMDVMEGMDPLLVSVVVKEMSRVSPGFCMSWGAGVGLCGGNILDKGTPAQIRKYAVPAITFEKIGAWALTEPEAGSDALGAMKTTARKDGDHYRISGSKTFITNAPYADIFVVYAKLDQGQPAAEQIPHAFILERAMKGLSTGSPLKKMGMKDSPTGEIFLDDVAVPAENLLGGKEKQGGRREVRDSLGSERTGICPMCLGIIEKCYEQSVKYAKKRRQFGRPIGEFQAVQLQIANMYIHLQNCWSIVLRLADMARAGKPDMAYVCATKAYAARAAVEVALDAIQIHGGYGYMEEYHIEKLMRDAKLLEIGAGTTHINLLTAARLELGIK
ncbi:MAG: acyl-CoA dehydrogenase family protein [Thermodesulfobacteriota bacterium]